ncbi:MAG TPA: hypothetical protein ENH82_04505 [bacterium]|nr:hypothetical protein [bacterium]
MNDPIMKVLERLHNVKKISTGFMSRCPSHKDRNNSLSISKGDDDRVLLKCHASCATEDVVSALGLSMSDLFSDNGSRKQKSTIVATYDYKDEKGKLLYQVVRYDPKKYSQRRPDGHGGFIWDLKGVQRVLYRLPELIEAVKNEQTILIPEGEADVDRLVKLGLHATTCSGGAGKWRNHYNEYLKGAKVVILPDADDPGRRHAEYIAKSLYGTAQSIRILELPGLKNKQDVSDWLRCGGTKEKLIELAKEAPIWELPEELLNKPEYVSENNEVNLEIFNNSPFHCLGYSHGSYYYLPFQSQQILELTPDRHTQSNLISLASLDWWQDNFPGKYNPSWNMAKNALFRKSEQVGIFDPRRIRGCGAWYDEGRVVLHHGDRLVIDGKLQLLTSVNSKYIYEAAFPVEISGATSLSQEKAKKLIDITDFLAWEKPVYSRLFCGWIVLAPICGALTWRPHIWITGSAGTGKSWVLENIMRPLLGNTALNVQSNSTEAGIRQHLRNNAFPVLFDEFEAENIKSQQRIQSVLELIRQASSESTATILKGTQSGHATSFQIRSCFCLSSIGVNVEQHADISRISVLTLQKHHPKDRIDIFDELKENVYSTLSKSWCAEFRARAIHMIPVIRDNTEVFSRTIAERFGDQRLGDQLGSLLAGAYSLYSDDVVDYEIAEKWISQQNWTDQTVLESETDEMKCLNQILQHTLIVTEDERRRERSIGQLVSIAADMYEQETNNYNDNNSEVTKKEAIATLARTGIKVSDDKLIISDSHIGIKKILKESPWSKNWGRILKRIDGITEKSAFRFELGTRTRATGIPLAKIYKEN